MKLQKIINRLQKLHPKEIDLSLDRINEVKDKIGFRQPEIDIFLVAGTNGKGSTAAMIQSILRENGLKVGLYTSPHLIRFNERIRINGLSISDEYIIEFMAQYNGVIDEVEATFFEATTVLALHYFSNKEVDLAVIETGLGGRLDSTNVIDPELSIITSIDLDHKHLLGETLIDIATEKAGIIKKQTPVF